MTGRSQSPRPPPAPAVSDLPSVRVLPSADLGPGRDVASALLLVSAGPEACVTRTAGARGAKPGVSTCPLPTSDPPADSATSASETYPGCGSHSISLFTKNLPSAGAGAPSRAHAKCQRHAGRRVWERTGSKSAIVHREEGLTAANRRQNLPPTEGPGSRGNAALTSPAPSSVEQTLPRSPTFNPAAKPASLSVQAAG